MIIKLKNRALIKVTGEDASSFLQSQFSNNIDLIKPNKIQINAYCQHQGKIMAILWVFSKHNHFYISLPEELKALIIKKINTYKMMSNVDIKDLSNQINQYGLVDEENKDAYLLKNNLSLLTTRKLVDGLESHNLWEKACIDNKIPEIFSSTSEKFTPQALNLDIDEFGASFSKGCYPGQEVVARMHYLGKPKRRLFNFLSESEAIIGDSITVSVSSSLRSSGVVLRVAKIDNHYQLSGTFEISHINDPIYLNDDLNKPLTIIDAQ